jgi:hypothetical protein
MLRVKHAGPETIARLESLLEGVRGIAGLREPRRGTFYRGSRAFLHFHEDAAGDFADLKVGEDWERHRVTTARERGALLRRARAVLAAD